MGMQHINFASQTKGNIFNAYYRLFPPCQTQVFMDVLTTILQTIEVL